MSTTFFGMPPTHYRNTKKTLQIYTDNLIVFGYLQGKAPPCGPHGYKDPFWGPYA
jgi:hypothetical protein